MTKRRDPLDIVFTSFPGPGSECVFVEVEQSGTSITIGTWVKLPSPRNEVALRITRRDLEQYEIE